MISELMLLNFKDFNTNNEKELHFIVHPFYDYFNGYTWSNNTKLSELETIEIEDAHDYLEKYSVKNQSNYINSLYEKNKPVVFFLPHHTSFFYTEQFINKEKENYIIVNSKSTFNQITGNYTDTGYFYDEKEKQRFIDFVKFQSFEKIILSGGQIGACLSVANSELTNIKCINIEFLKELCFPYLFDLEKEQKQLFNDLFSKKEFKKIEEEFLKFNEKSLLELND